MIIEEMFQKLNILDDLISGFLLFFYSNVNFMIDTNQCSIYHLTLHNRTGYQFSFSNCLQELLDSKCVSRIYFTLRINIQNVFDCYLD